MHNVRRRPRADDLQSAPPSPSAERRFGVDAPLDAAPPTDEFVGFAHDAFTASHPTQQCSWRIAQSVQNVFRRMQPRLADLDWTVVHEPLSDGRRRLPVAQFALWVLVGGLQKVPSHDRVRVVHAQSQARAVGAAHRATGESTARSVIGLAATSLGSEHRLVASCGLCVGLAVEQKRAVARPESGNGEALGAHCG